MGVLQASGFLIRGWLSLLTPPVLFIIYEGVCRLNWMRFSQNPIQIPNSNILANFCAEILSSTLRPRLALLRELVRIRSSRKLLADSANSPAPRSTLALTAPAVETRNVPPGSRCRERASRAHSTKIAMENNPYVAKPWARMLGTTPSARHWQI